MSLPPRLWTYQYLWRYLWFPPWCHSLTSPRGGQHQNAVFIILLLLLKNSFITYLCISTLPCFNFACFSAFKNYRRVPIPLWQCKKPPIQPTSWADYSYSLWKQLPENLKTKAGKSHGGVKTWRRNKHEGEFPGLWYLSLTFLPWGWAPVMKWPGADDWKKPCHLSGKGVPTDLGGEHQGKEAE